MRWLALALGLCAALAAGCKEQPTPPPYVPERTRTIFDAAPPAPAPTDAGMLGDDDSVTQCVKECVQRSQMRAESPQAIRLRCLDTCEGRCVERCNERARRRGLVPPDGGLWDDCAEVCRLD